MVARCDDAGVMLMTAFPMRFSPPVIAAREALLDGNLGRVYGCNATNQGQLPTEAPWFIDPQLAGGGALMDHVVHVADLLRWFFGSEVREVYALANRILYPELEAQVETGAVVLLDFEDGSFASIDSSWSRPPQYSTWGNVKLEIVGERGLLTLDAFRQASTVYRRGAPGAQLAYWGSDANQGLIDEFVDSLLQGRAPAISGEDGIQASAIAEAALLSARSGEPVPL
jgi:predicted dehydrogenase